MTKVDIFSGFLGAGKTTLIKKLISEAYSDERMVLIENEFGEIGVDKGFLKDTGIQINEMNAGCICCTLVGDFGRALNEVIEKYNPERIIIEPSGVGKLSDVIIAVQDLDNEKIELNGFTTVVDAKKCEVYMKNFGEFYENQVEHASSIILSHTKGLSQEQIDKVITMIREINKDASIVTTEWEEINGAKILEIMEKKKTLSTELNKLREEAYVELEAYEHHEQECCHHHEHDDDEHECCHHHEHDDDEHECCHHHEHDDDEHECCHHHEHDEDEHECCHHHEHDDDNHECCHHHDHDDDEHEHHHHHHSHHGHHHADEVFDEFGVETAHKFTEEKLAAALDGLRDSEEVGQVLRAKGIVEGESGDWYHFDYVPDEPEIRKGESEATGMICVIGVGLEKDKIKDLFGLSE